MRAASRQVPILEVMEQSTRSRNNDRGCAPQCPSVLILIGAPDAGNDLAQMIRMECQQLFRFGHNLLLQGKFACR